MKKLSVVSLALVMMMTVMTMPAKAEVVFNESIPFDLSVFVPCADGGVGEIVELSGPLHIVISFTINNNRVSIREHAQPQGISGVGQSTGDSYRAVGVTKDSANLPFTNGAATATFVNNFRIIGQGPGNNFMVHENSHITINANGDVSSTHTNFRVSCS
ncbi:MAG: hypothetical protein WBD22_08900 [Pyrinomonadaceae bacterium]